MFPMLLTNNGDNRRSMWGGAYVVWPVQLGLCVPFVTGWAAVVPNLHHLHMCLVVGDYRYFLRYPGVLLDP